MPPEQAPATAAQVAEVSTKLDVLLAQHAQVAAQVADHEQRIRVTETKQTITEGRVKDLTKRDTDQEARIRKSDQWRYAMPIASVGGAGAVLTGVAALVTSLGGG